jgi:hypothetical protein
MTELVGNLSLGLAVFVAALTAWSQWRRRSSAARADERGPGAAGRYLGLIVLASAALVAAFLNSDFPLRIRLALFRARARHTATSWRRSGRDSREAFFSGPCCWESSAWRS